jgi:hypothetical protein
MTAIAGCHLFSFREPSRRLFTDCEIGRGCNLLRGLREPAFSHWRLDCLDQAGTNMISTLGKLLLASALVSFPWASEAQPIVLELFTSQSCSSCPPADALLTQLAKRPDVLALDMHVDYWNGIGWHDPFSFSALTQRQSRYAQLLGQDSVYTPELVVGGKLGVVGSDSAAIDTAIVAIAAENASHAPIPMQLTRGPNGLRASVAASTGDATLWLAGYDLRRETHVGGGENGGRTLIESNVVRSLSPVASWSGQALQMDLPVPSGNGAAIFLQAGDGRIIGAARLE